MPAEASPTPRSRLARVRRCARIFLTHLVSQVGLCLLVVAYSIVGALIFRAIEADKEVHQRQRVSQLRRRYLRDMWAVTERLNVLHDEEWMAEVGAKLKEFEDEVVLAVRNDGYDGKDAQEEALQWSFSGSLLYSITVITTIGSAVVTLQRLRIVSWISGSGGYIIIAGERLTDLSGNYGRLGGYGAPD
ncbi:hypothetical protein HPB50_017423 [Hyalomma asiaticum]|uniref:Uncharacterized protein n=1 Tax=Hyalomma asiaticum TaxID=266040 RepID=A0ACB7SFL8_HYAAI|nr:hypothetical protein HPB50_017423 [Hyalomma asiaticum]